MTDFPDRLSEYPSLSPPERDAVDAYVEAHPEWAPALDEARDLAAVLDRARGGLRPVDVAEAVAGATRGRPLDAEVAAALEADAGLRAHAETVRSRIDALDAEREDPVAQFERLTARADRAAEPSVDRGARAPSRTTTDRAPDRAAAPPARSRALRLVRPLAYAAAVLVAAYGALFLVSTQSVSDRDRLADLSSLSEYEPLRLRGGEADDLDGRLDEVLDGVDDARRSVLGLFPRYDEVELDAVAVALEDVVSAAAAGSAIHEEALFALARVRFFQGRTTAARGALEALVERRGARAAEARRLLDALGETV